MKYTKQPDGTYAPSPGHEALWCYFGLSRASFLTMSRAFMHEMPDDWQARMAALLHEWDATWDYSKLPDYVKVDLEVRAKKNGRLIALPEDLTNYRHPDSEVIQRWMRHEDITKADESF